MGKVFVVQDAASQKFEDTLENELKSNFKSGIKVAVKLHFGELKGMFDPQIAKRAVSVLKKLGCKPFLFDTTVMYPGPRHFKASYKLLAAAHGFSEKKIGCPVLISDDYVKIKTEHMDVEVSKDMSEADAMLVLSHVKGHPCAGFGGAIKNLAMGCVSPKSKKDQHSLGSPTVNDNCTACGICEEVCPFHAIKIKDKAKINKMFCMGCSNCYYNCPNKAMEAKVTFDTLLAEAAVAVIGAMKNKPVYYVNDVRNITKKCDCFPLPGEKIAADVGLVLCDDLVLVDKASLELISKKQGKDVFNEANNHDPNIAVDETKRIISGSSK